MATWQIVLIVVLVVILLFAVEDLLQRKHAVRRNFPIVGRFRYLLEAVGPELRQYIVTSNTEEEPFSRDARRWVYASAKGENNRFGFGSDENMEEQPNYLILKQSAFAVPGVRAADGLPAKISEWEVPCAKVVGEARGRAKAFRPRSIVNISGMSFGALSGHAVEALNRGAKMAGVLQDTGEGGLSPYHQNGGELIFQIASGYFGCRDIDGNFDLDRLKALVSENPVRAIEIKMSQGAKPGGGGILPGPKVTAEIAQTRGVRPGIDCISPPYHSAFHDVNTLLDFVELIASETGIPVGIKAAVGESEFWVDLAEKMRSGERGVDFITIDGGEGGTGAAPLAFTDHVGFPFKVAFTTVYKIFAEAGIEDRVVWIGSGKLGFPHSAMLAFAIGCDMINVGREAMLSIGCIQSQKCHTDRCPTGVATQNKWLARGLDPNQKYVRCAHYVMTLRKEILELTRACGRVHHALVDPSQLEMLDDRFHSQDLGDLFGYDSSWRALNIRQQAQIEQLMLGDQDDVQTRVEQPTEN